MRKQIKIFLILGLIVVAGFLIYSIVFYSSRPKISPQPDILEELPLTPKKVDIQIFPGKIEPNIFRAKAGQEVTLFIVSMEGTHSIVFEAEELSWVGGEFNEPGQTLEITFTAPREKGEYRLFCKEPGHREAGEEALMVVE